MVERLRGQVEWSVERELRERQEVSGIYWSFVSYCNVPLLFPKRCERVGRVD